jgi:hypothetical protein
MVGKTQRLVRPGVERPQDHLGFGEGLDHLTVDRRLFVDRRLLLPIQETQFGAEQSHAPGRGSRRDPGPGPVLHVGEHIDAMTIRGRARP